MENEEINYNGIHACIHEKKSALHLHRDVMRTAFYYQT